MLSELASSYGYSHTHKSNSLRTRRCLRLTGAAVKQVTHTKYLEIDKLAGAARRQLTLASVTCNGIPSLRFTREQALMKQRYTIFSDMAAAV